jgi:thiol-disulfide isomerase/thioredoxin
VAGGDGPQIAGFPGPAVPPHGSGRSSWWARHRRSRALRLGLALTLCAVVGASVATALTTSAGTPNIAFLNLPLPRFSLSSLVPGGPRVSSVGLSDGSAVVLNFWGSWCPPCQAEMPALQAAHRELGRKVTFVGIDVQDTRHAAIALLRSVGVTYPSGFDASGAVEEEFDTNGTPATYFISHGRIIDLHPGGLTEGALLTDVRLLFGIT